MQQRVGFFPLFVLIQYPGFSKVSQTAVMTLLLLSEDIEFEKALNLPFDSKHYGLTESFGTYADFLITVRSSITFYN